MDAPKQLCFPFAEPQELVTIPKSEYDSLKGDANWRACVEAAGVDNWQGFDYAMEMLREEAED